MRIYKNEIRLFRLLSLLLVTVLSAVTLLPKQAAQRSAEESGSFVLRLCEVEAALLPHLHIGDRVIDRQNRCILGDILEIRTEESHREIFSETDGAWVSARVPERFDLHLTLSARREDGRLFTEDGIQPKIGQVYYFRTYDFIGTGRVVELI